MTDNDNTQDGKAMSPASTGSVGGNKPVAWAVVKIGSPEILFTSEAQSSAMDYIAKKRRPEQWGLVPLIRPPVATPTLTDAEREAVEWYANFPDGIHAATLRGLLERLGGAR